MENRISTLVVFCKRPKLGQGKQRLALTIGMQATFELASLFVSQTAKLLKQWEGPVVVALTSDGDLQWATDNLGGYTTFLQGEGNLGDRLNFVDQSLRRQGHQNLLFIGTDSPSLNIQHLKSSCQKLLQYDTVYIPTVDGGVALMGSRCPWPNLSSIRWSSPMMYRDILKLCSCNALSSTSLPYTYDVDYVEDIFRLSTDTKTLTTFEGFTHWKKKYHQQIYTEKLAISVVIPTFQDNDALSQTLSILASFSNPVHEVIVVDGAADAICETTCRHYKVKYYRAPKGRGIQLNLGAQKAEGSILWFLHADATPAQDSPQRIIESIRNGHDAGCFSFKFSGKRTWIKKILEWGTNLRARYFTPYGDQGHFIRKDTFYYLDGYAKVPLFEEVQLIRKIRKHFKFKYLKAPIEINPRKWEKEGWVKTSLLNRLYCFYYQVGISPKKLSQQYESRSSKDTFIEK